MIEVVEEPRHAELVKVRCDHYGCHEETLIGTRADLVGWMHEQGWQLPRAGLRPGESGKFLCPDHVEFKPCILCERPIRPWMRRQDDFDFITVSAGRGGMCSGCTTGTDNGRLNTQFNQVRDAVARYEGTRTKAYFDFIENTLDEEIHRLAGQLLDRHGQGDLKEVLALG